VTASLFTAVVLSPKRTGTLLSKDVTYTVMETPDESECSYTS